MGLLPRTARRKPSLKRPGCLRGVYARRRHAPIFRRKSDKRTLSRGDLAKWPPFRQHGIAEKVRPALGGEPAAREPGLGTGRGGDVTGLAWLLVRFRVQRGVAVIGSARGSPSETQTF